MDPVTAGVATSALGAGGLPPMDLGGSSSATSGDSASKFGNIEFVTGDKNTVFLIGLGLVLYFIWKMKK